jgi:hypothetical protein
MSDTKSGGDHVAGLEDVRSTIVGWVVMFEVLSSLLVYAHLLE